MPAFRSDLTDDEAAALLRELDGRIDGDRYFLSERIKTLKAIRAKLRPEPVREPLPGHRNSMRHCGRQLSRDGARAARTRGGHPAQRRDFAGSLGGGLLLGELTQICGIM